MKLLTAALKYSGKLTAKQSLALDHQLIKASIVHGTKTVGTRSVTAFILAKGSVSN
ncbi:MAG TPA: hypothetical protein VGK22_17360 [Candidatus Angelobacter sp.]|jgi:hypothetical protein